MLLKYSHSQKKQTAWIINTNFKWWVWGKLFNSYNWYLKTIYNLKRKQRSFELEDTWTKITAAKFMHLLKKKHFSRSFHIFTLFFTIFHPRWFSQHFPAFFDSLVGKIVISISGQLRWKKTGKNFELAKRKCLYNFSSKQVKFLPWGLDGKTYKNTKNGNNSVKMLGHTPLLVRTSSEF